MSGLTAAQLADFERDGYGRWNENAAQAVCA